MTKSNVNTTADAIGAIVTIIILILFLVDIGNISANIEKKYQFENVLFALLYAAVMGYLLSRFINSSAEFYKDFAPIRPKWLNRQNILARRWYALLQLVFILLSLLIFSYYVIWEGDFSPMDYLAGSVRVYSTNLVPVILLVLLFCTLVLIEIVRLLTISPSGELTTVLNQSSPEKLNIDDKSTTSFESSNAVDKSLDQLEKLAELRTKGFITEKEFDQQKKKILDSGANL